MRHSKDGSPMRKLRVSHYWSWHRSGRNLLLLRELCPQGRSHRSPRQRLAPRSTAWEHRLGAPLGSAASHGSAAWERRIGAPPGSAGLRPARAAEAARFSESRLVRALNRAASAARGRPEAGAPRWRSQAALSGVLPPGAFKTGAVPPSLCPDIHRARSLCHQSIGGSPDFQFLFRRRPRNSLVAFCVHFRVLPYRLRGSFFSSVPGLVP